MKALKYIFLLISFSVIGQTITLNELKAFPTAEGFGKHATGGGGGSVLFVTNLNNSGAGSFRAAAEASGARTVIFRVGGTISLSSAIVIDDPNITIAGQTAPGNGILFRNHEIQFRADNQIVRHIRARVGSGAGSNIDAFRILATSGTVTENVILDHCSSSWATDENLSFGIFSTGSIRDCTVQNSIIADGGYGTLVSANVYRVSIINNYYAHNSDRNVRIGHYDDIAPQLNDLRAEVINNLFYNFNYAVNQTYGTKGSFIGNYYRLRTGQTMALGNVFQFTTSGEYPGSRSDTEIYLDDNILSGTGTLQNSNINAYKVSSPPNSSGINPVLASTIPSTIFSDVGAYSNLPQGLDAVDLAFIQNYADDAIAAAESYPTISGGTPYPDSNNDGISDTWASTHDISSASQVKSTYTINGKTIINNAGYTALEIFLAELAGDFERLPLDDGPGPGPDPEPQPGKGKGFNRNILLTLD